MRGLAIPCGAHSQSLARAVASPSVTQSQAAGQSQQQRCGAHSPAASSAIAKTPHRQARQPNLGDLPQRIRLCFGTPVNWRTRRGSANAWLKGTLTRGTPALYSAQPNRANNSHRKSNFPKLARVWDLTCTPDVSGFSSLTFPQVSASTSSKALRASSTSPKLKRVRDRSRASLGQKHSFSSA